MALKTGKGEGLSKREKVLIVLLIVIIEVFLLHKYLYQPAINNLELEKNRLETSQNILGVLQIEKNKIDEFERIEDTLYRNEEIYTEILDKSISQEIAIYEIKNMIDGTDINISSYSIEVPAYKPVKEYIEEINSRDDVKERINNYAKSGYVITQPITLSMEGSIEDIFEFIEKIENSVKLKIIDSFSFSKGTETLNLYLSYTNYGFSKSLEDLSLDEDDKVVLSKRDNPFTEEQIKIDEDQRILYNIDISEDENSAPYIAYIDNAEAYMFSILKKEESLSIEIKGENGAYTILNQYDNQKYESDIIYDFTDKPILFVINSFKEDNEDYMLNISYKNLSDKRIEFEINNDSKNPKVEINEEE